MFHRLFLFQFHTGSIKSDSGMGFWLKQLRFNSTMVRLKVVEGLIDGDGFSMFQFHNGSIKSGFHRQHRKHQRRVSIPQWFD